MVNEPSKGAATPAPAGIAPGVRAVGVRPCPTCGAPVNAGATVCPSCGEPLAARAKKIRCRRCHQPADASLVICPHCGRELHAAPSRLLTWGIPALVLLLLLGMLATRLSRGNPVNWVQTQVQRTTRFIGGLGERLQPEVSISLVPPGQDANDPLLNQIAQSANQGASALQAAPQLQVEGQPPSPAQQGEGQPSPSPANPPAAAVVSDTATATTEAQATTAPTAAPTPTSAATATVAPTQTPAATATAAATATRAATATATATRAPAAGSAVSPTIALSATRSVTPSTSLAAAGVITVGANLTSSVPITHALGGLLLPSPTPTETPAAVAAAIREVYKVRAGDTVYDIASRYDMDVADLLAANDLSPADAQLLQPGDELKIPAATPAPGPGAGTPTPAAQVYTIRPGDTLGAIAGRTGVSIEDLLAVNNMTMADVRALQPGDALIIATPGPATETPTATATSEATSTPTALPAATATPVSTMRLDAPILRSPEDGTTVSCSDEQTLNWQGVPSISPTDMYVVHLGYVNGRASDGSDNVLWILSQQRPSSTTQWRLDNSFCGVAPVESGRQWRWYVDVVENGAAGFVPVSPPSQTWRFVWQ